MKISIVVDDKDITLEELYKTQTQSRLLGGGFDIEYGINGATVSWDIIPEDPVKFIELIDNLIDKYSCDVLDVCPCIDVDTIRYNPNVNIYSISDNIHIPNSFD